MVGVRVPNVIVLETKKFLRLRLDVSLEAIQNVIESRFSVL